MNKCRGLTRIPMLLWALMCWMAFTHNAQAQTYQARITLADVSVLLDGANERIELQNQALPWKWDKHFLQQRGTATFRVMFALNPEQFQAALRHSQGLGMVALNMGNRYRFRVNQADWQTVGWDESTTQYRSKPKWHHLPANLLFAGNNTIDIELRLEPANDAGLSALELGEASDSLRLFQSEVDARQYSVMLVIVSSFLLAVLALGMWWVSREPLFFWACLSEFFFATRQMAIFVDYPPIRTWIWNAIFASLFALYVGCIVKVSEVLVADQTRRSNPIGHRIIDIYLLLSVPFLMTGYALGDYRFYRAWLVVMILLSLVFVVRITWYALRSTNTAINIRLYALAAWTSVILGLYDFFVIQLGESGLGKLRLSTYTSLLFNLGLAMIVIRKYIEAKQDVIEVKSKTQLEQTRATLLERQRIMADIHDTVGAQLAGVLDLIRAGAPHDQLQTQTAEALDDLRIAIDAIQPVNGSLTAVLATLRHRIEPRLSLHHIQLIWRADQLPRITHLTPQTIQHVQRLILEAMSNIIRHAKASRIVLVARASADNAAIVIHITDDGIGFDEARLASTGQGLRTMRLRAQAIGASLMFERVEPHGSSLTLIMPVMEF